MSVTIQLRGDSAANWTTANPTLHVREMGLETDTGKIKVGDGVTAWASLAYFSGTPFGGGTLTEYLAPKVVALTDGSSIAVDADDGNDFYVTLGGNRTMAAPANAADRQKISFEIIQDGTGSRTLTWASGTGGYSFGSGSAPALSTAAGATDQVAFAYSARKSRWLYLGSDGGF